MVNSTANTSSSASSESSFHEDLIINSVTTTTSTSLTNSIVVTELPDMLFNSTELLSQLRDLITHTSNGNILNFIVLKSFRRIVIIFDNFQSSYIIKNTLHNTNLNQDILLNIYLLDYIQPAGSGESEQNLLQVDQFEQLFWLSPPPSPPADWMPQVEDGPNTKTLANDLMQALSKLQLEEIEQPHCNSPITQFKFEDSNLPTIIVEDVDPNTVNFIDKARLPKTSMPPTPELMTSLSS